MDFKSRKERKALTVHILASKGCTQGEIAKAIGISTDTLQRDTELYESWKRDHNCIISVSAALNSAQAL